MSAANHLSLDTALIESFTDLDRARSIALGCVRCDLAATRTHVAFGEGHATARLMLVGEGPGADEDLQGRPFVGRAGKLLDGILEEAGLSRDEVWITNIVRCRPVRLEAGRKMNRPPRIDEIRACSVWMDTELRLVTPRIVICLGAIAAKALIRSDFRLMEERGRWFPGPRGTEATATFHPSYVLHIREPEARRRTREAMREDISRAAQRVTANSVKS